MTEVDALKHEIEELKRKQALTDATLQRLIANHTHHDSEEIKRRDEAETAYLKVLARTGGHEAIREYQRSKRRRQAPLT